MNHAEAALYYGSVDFNGTVYLNWSLEAVSGVKVQLLEDGSAKRTDYTDSNGYYEFTWTTVKLKFYSISIEKDGYKFTSKYVLITNAEHEEDLTLYGKAALFLWASDVANRTVIDELRDDLIYNESFTDVLYYENASYWEDAIDDLDTYESSFSLVFIYVITHGDNRLTGIIPNREWHSYLYYQTMENQNINFTAADFIDKLAELEASDIIFLIEACHSGDFILEFEKPEHQNDPFFAATAANFTQAARWYGVNGTRYNESDGDQGAWGGAFTHFFFEGLHLGYNETDAFYYAKEETYDYALAVIGPDDLYQFANMRETLSTDWL